MSVCFRNKFFVSVIPKSEVAKLVDEQKLTLANVSDSDQRNDAEPSSKRLKLAGKKVWHSEICFLSSVFVTVATDNRLAETKNGFTYGRFETVHHVSSL